MTILGGAWIFLAVVILLIVAVIYGLYSRTGSGINGHSYSRRYGDAPGADDARRVSGKDGLASIMGRGTR